MLRAVFLGALALACAFVVSLFVAVPGWSAGLHPRCNIDWPCAVPMASAAPTSSREARRVARGQAIYDAMPFGMPTDRAGRALPASQVIGGRPSGCPHRFCGCGASLHLFGKIIPRLNLAANWLRLPRAAPAPNMAAARRGHVMVLKRHLGGSTWLVFDANSGGGKTRLHARSIVGFVIVDPSGAG